MTEQQLHFIKSLGIFLQSYVEDSSGEKAPTQADKSKIASDTLTTNTEVPFIRRSKWPDRIMKSMVEHELHPTDMMNQTQVAEFLRCSTTWVNHLTWNNKYKKLTAYANTNGRLCYNRKEVEDYARGHKH